MHSGGPAAHLAEKVAQAQRTAALGVPHKAKRPAPQTAAASWMPWGCSGRALALALAEGAAGAVCVVAVRGTEGFLAHLRGEVAGRALAQ
eukprot:CAMPEP_0206011386 /NCGR_PEP_ID=MMETSP1464-20131121/13147_1 /ASSEMBLY_ACC=CAM_ASM_001124 /TAXON_ID=119497 /ORGANISM="Exanthemachrysis gayraliae, Strain RCC1523" /LENGTH=89 /DNA_ID=CAMNT_0053385049 /DNA_START=103 /DNA_END=369 /DNA_ORIENTATION=-